MSVPTKFMIGEVSRLEQGSKEIGSERRYVVGVRKALIGCLTCSHVWEAREGNGLEPAMGAIILKCPECKTTESISPAAFGLPS